eukprot:NODE_1236_length_1041_cov_75.737903_g947_i0.p1 GENE.NODE_1236_length_1041_cov_75.737903_g947_i0~~NODE_1236_length_1041_cov_75.737903_g947_i0.p1  ORF type:complete len:289 (-),score=31.36 NODE_1236_length_1041_cov_75.737903_g947_i0:5-871(-)
MRYTAGGGGTNCSGRCCTLTNTPAAGLLWCWTAMWSSARPSLVPSTGASMGAHLLISGPRQVLAGSYMNTTDLLFGKVKSCHMLKFPFFIPRPVFPALRQLMRQRYSSPLAFLSPVQPFFSMLDMLGHQASRMTPPVVEQVHCNWQGSAKTCLTRVFGASHVPYPYRAQLPASRDVWKALGTYRRMNIKNNAKRYMTVCHSIMKMGACFFSFHYLNSSYCQTTHTVHPDITPYGTISDRDLRRAFPLHEPVDCHHPRVPMQNWVPGNAPFSCLICVCLKKKKKKKTLR